MSDRPKKKKKKTIEQIRATNNKKNVKISENFIIFCLLWSEARRNK